ncbi:hypothetical protein LINPERPRIM_LOCUS24260 [Linum perenne]
MFESCGRRTVNLVNGAVGPVLDGELACLSNDGGDCAEGRESESYAGAYSLVLDLRSRRNRSEWRNRHPPMMKLMTRTNDLDLRLTPSIYPKAVPLYKPELRRSGSPSMNSEESVTTTCLDSSAAPGA